MPNPVWRKTTNKYLSAWGLTLVASTPLQPISKNMKTYPMYNCLCKVWALACLAFLSLPAHAGNLGKLGIGYIYGGYEKDPVHFTLYRYFLDHPMVVGGDTLHTLLTPHPASAEFFLTGEIKSGGVIKLWNNGAVAKEFPLGTSYLRTEQELESFHKTLYRFLNPSAKKTDEYIYKNTGRTYTPASLANDLYTMQAEAKFPSSALPNATLFTFWPSYTAKDDKGFSGHLLTDPLGSYEDLYFLQALSGHLKLEAGPRLGIAGNSQAAVVNKQKKVTQPAGLLLTSVERESNAHKDGLKGGDLVTHINNTAVTTIADVQKLLAGNGNGRFTLKLLRAGKPLTLTTSAYQTYNWTSAEETTFHASLDYRHTYAGELSFTVEDFDKKYAEKRKWTTASGVRISSFNSQSISRKTVLETDDILVSMNGQAIGSSKDFGRFLSQQLAGQQVKLELIRKGQKIWVEDVIVPKERQVKLTEGSPFAGMQPLAQSRIEQGKDDPALFASLFAGSGKKEVIQYANALLAMNTGSFYLSKNYFKILDADILSSSHKQALTNLLHRRRWEAYTLNTITAARLLQLAQEPGAALMAYQQALQQLKDVHSTPRRVAVMQHYILSRIKDVAASSGMPSLEDAVQPALTLARYQLTDSRLFSGDTAYWRRIQYIGQVSDLAQSKLKEEKKQKLKNTIGALAMTAGTVASYSQLGTAVGEEMLQQTLVKVSNDKENISQITSQMNATFSAVQIRESFGTLFDKSKNATGTALAGEFLHLAYAIDNKADLYRLLSTLNIQQAFPESKALLAKLGSGTSSSSAVEEVLVQLSALILAKEQKVFTNELSKL